MVDSRGESSSINGATSSPSQSKKEKLSVFRAFLLALPSLVLYCPPLVRNLPYNPVQVSKHSLFQYLCLTETIGQSMTEDTITKRLHVSGLTPAIRPSDLSQKLGSFGTVKALDGFDKVDGLGEPRKFGYVTIETTKTKLARCACLPLIVLVLTIRCWPCRHEPT